MPIDFPNSPTTNQVYTVSGRTWIYDGEKWGLQGVSNSVVLDGLSDVTAPSPTSGDFLKWNGSAWVNTSGQATPTTLGSVYAQTPAFFSGGYFTAQPAGAVNLSWNTTTRTFQTTNNFTSIFLDGSTLAYLGAGDLYVGREISVSAYDGAFNFYLSWTGTISSVTSNSVTFSATNFNDFSFNIGTGGSAIGSSFLSMNDTNASAAYGHGAMRTVSGLSQHNTAVGVNALREILDSESNIAIGRNSMNRGSTPIPVGWYNNIAIGLNSGTQLADNTQGAVILGGHQGSNVTSNTVLLSDGYGSEFARFNFSNFTIQYQTGFRANRSTNYSYQNNTEVVPIIFNSVNFNTNSAYNVNNGRFTAPVAGRYWFNASVWTSSGALPSHVWLIRNGVRSLTIAHNDDDWIAAGGTFIFLNAGDWVAIGAGMGGPSGVGTIAGSQINTYFTGYLVH